jgi:hypothetical protein
LLLPSVSAQVGRIYNLKNHKEVLEKVLEIV